MRALSLAAIGLCLLPSLAFAQASAAGEQKGDASVGWCLWRDATVNFLTCGTVSSANRVAPHVDAVVGLTYAYKSQNDVSAHLFDFGGGVRVGGPNGKDVRVFGQVLFGIGIVRLAGGGDAVSSTGFSISPSYGVDFKVSKHAWIRPEIGSAIVDFKGHWGLDTIFRVSAVFGRW